MAGVVDKLRKKSKSSNTSEWSRSGTLLSKPAKGWLHVDHQLSPDAGVCYAVRYIGCMEVKTSMKSLDFDTRTLVAKESISRVCDAAGLKTAMKKKKLDKKLSRLLGDQPNMQYAGSNVHLTITTDSLNIMVMETGEIIANHQMHGISFASGGDPDTMDFIAYVAKDPVNGRACHVLECGGGLAQDVITTVGQAFELRFKQFLANQPRPVYTVDRLDSTQEDGKDSWGVDPEYYNDRPDAMPPQHEAGAAAPEYAEPSCNLLVSDGMYSSLKGRKELLYDNRHLDSDGKDSKGAVGENFYDNREKGANVYNEPEQSFNVYDNPDRGSHFLSSPCFDDVIYDNSGAAAPNGNVDAFDLQPFTEGLPPSVTQSQTESSESSKSERNPFHEEWFHGSLSRQQAEDLLHNSGDFLVRESSNSPGQYVLSGKMMSKTKHLLLVDPAGVVRTKDRTFDSVSHLVHFHLDNGLPIVSEDSELILKQPIINSKC